MTFSVDFARKNALGISVKYPSAVIRKVHKLYQNLCMFGQKLKLIIFLILFRSLPRFVLTTIFVSSFFPEFY